MPIVVSHDKETFGEADLKAVGAYKYAADPATDCLLTSGMVAGDSRIRRWRPGQPYPYADIHNDDIQINAWNSSFERRIWWDIMVPRYGWPRLDLEQFVCTAAHGRITAAGPARLDIAGKFFNRRHKKDNKGHLHMLKMCRPAKAGGGREHHTPDALDQLHAYCDQDVRTEMDIAAMLPPWREEDLEDFWLNEHINDHGLVVDRDFAVAASAYAEEEKAYFAEEIRRITGNEVETPRQFQRIQKWALPRMSEEAQAICRWYDNGAEKYTFDADTRANLLSEAASDFDFMDEDVVELVELMDAAGKSAISKYQAIANRAMTDADGNWRIHGLYVYAGASQTGRASSVGLQAHNLVRNVPKNAKALISAFKRDDAAAIRAEVKVWGEAAGKERPEAVHALGQLIRPTFTGCPQDGFDLVWCDWSAIEACANPWLSLHPGADDRLATFRKGEDIYCKTASKLFGRTVTPEDEEDRMFGKVMELFCGFLGGLGAGKSMAKNLGMRIPDAKLQSMIKSWREDNQWAVEFGANCVQAAMHALRRTDGASFSAGRLNYRYDTEALDGIGCLYCMLPSGREIPYPGARIQVVVPKWGGEQLGITVMKAAWHPKKGEPWEQWPRMSLWNGLCIENATQAICADLLKLGLDRADREGLAISSHVHDEVVIETDDPVRDAPILHGLMTKRPPWPGADLLPLRAKVEFGFRYKIPFKD